MTSTLHACTTPGTSSGDQRFRLGRAGILNVWQYDEQVFTFADGRLLLRGANGAGKSKTLEMLLPFALDGDKARITASAKHHTSLLWLMTDGMDSGNRVGYVWVEFVRDGGGTTPEVFTCGIGIRASVSARSATAWHFTTSRRIGHDLSLLEVTDSTQRSPGSPDDGPTAASRDARSRVELAARLLGDAHALDVDHVLHRVVLHGLAAAEGQPTPEGARGRDELWARHGIVPDLLSRTCLVWRLRVAGNDSFGRRLDLAHASGDPVHVTDWDLRRARDLTLLPERRILVCENPRVLEAVAEQAVDNWTVVCTSGEPNLVVGSVLEALVGVGSIVLYHGDFDWPGVAIANRVVDRFGAVPWHMDAADYVRGVRPDGPELRGDPVEPSWSAELGAAMRVRGRALHEESVLAELLQDVRGR